MFKEYVSFSMQSECTKLIRCRARPPMGVESCRRVVGYKEEKHFAQLTGEGENMNATTK